MTDRIHIGSMDIYSGNFSKDKKYIHIPYHQWKDLIIYRSELLSKFDINLIAECNISLSELPNFSYISKNIIVKESIHICSCPLLKTIPIELTIDKKLYFSHNQQLITILSKEQFFSLKALFINYHLIKSYEQYYSIINPTLIKNNLMKICL